MASLSIIVPVLDEEARIGAALAALAPFRARGAEVIVADGGSRDRTVEIARPLADRVIAAPRGRGAQMNAGAAAASGDVLLFLHADTTLPPDADALMLEGLRDTARQWGRFDVRIEGRSPLLAVIVGLHELALAPHRHRHRRPGDVRHPRGVRRGRRLSRHPADGRRRAVEATEARRAGRSVSPPASSSRAGASTSAARCA